MVRRRDWTYSGFLGTPSMRKRNSPIVSFMNTSSASRRLAVVAMYWTSNWAVSWAFNSIIVRSMKKQSISECPPEGFLVFFKLRNRSSTVSLLFLIKESTHHIDSVFVPNDHHSLFNRSGEWILHLWSRFGWTNQSNLKDTTLIERIDDFNCWFGYFVEWSFDSMGFLVKDKHV